MKKSSKYLVVQASTGATVGAGATAGATGAAGAAKVIITLPKSTQKEKKNNKIWCIHNGKTTTTASCPYTKKQGLTCSMPHCDQPNGKFDQF